MWLALTQNTHNKSSSRHGGEVAVAHGEGRWWVWWSGGPGAACWEPEAGWQQVRHLFITEY